MDLHLDVMHSDTTKEAARLRLTTLRDLGGVERLKQALDLSEAVRRLAEQGERDRKRVTPRDSGAGSG